jgi:hypothetical protein
METSFEFLTTGKAGRGVQRHLPDEVKVLSSSRISATFSFHCEPLGCPYGFERKGFFEMQVDPSEMKKWLKFMRKSTQ